MFNNSNRCVNMRYNGTYDLNWKKNQTRSVCFLMWPHGVSCTNANVIISINLRSFHLISTLPLLLCEYCWFFTYSMILMLLHVGVLCICLRASAPALAMISHRRRHRSPVAGHGSRVQRCALVSFELIDLSGRLLAPISSVGPLPLTCAAA